MLPFHRSLQTTILLATLGLLAPLSRGDDPTNTAEDFFRPPKIFGVRMSPDGETFAGLAPIGKDGTIGLVLVDRATLEPTTFRGSPGRDVNRYTWVSDEDVVFNLIKWNTFVSGVYRVSRDKGDVTTLLDDQIVAYVFDPMVDDPEYSWLWIRDRAQGRPGIAKLRKTADAESRNAMRKGIFNDRTLRSAEDLPSGETFRCISDHAGEVRLLLLARDGTLQYMHRQHSGEDWVPLAIDAEEWKVISFHPDNETLFVVGYAEHDTLGLYLFDREANAPIELVFRDDTYDFDETAYYKYFNGHLVGLTYHRTAPTSVWFVSELEQIQAMVDQAIPGKANVIYDWNRDFSRLLIHSYSDTAPVAYAYLDLQAMELKEIAPSAPWIDESGLSPTQIMRLETPDGLELEGYVTLPQTGRAPYPTVSLVHGGPWARDTGGYNAEVQYLASLGYAVVRLNYRGSSGFGKRISEDPAFDFRAMHDDITWANRQLIKSGIIDPDRLAIMGASFGGFAALAGAAFEPEMYRCAVTTVGVFDWAELVKDRKRQDRDFSYARMVEELGDPANAEAFEDISPIKHADEIKIPVFIAHGKGDKNVSVSQSKRLVSALKRRGIPHETFFREWEGHGFVGENRIELYERIGEFLAKNL
ncbi:MAG: alpha/beta hydrolase family protein [Opitutales bacterium]